MLSDTGCYFWFRLIRQIQFSLYNGNTEVLPIAINLRM